MMNTGTSVIFGYILPCIALCSLYFYRLRFTRRYTIRLIAWSNKKQQPFVRTVQRIRLMIPATAKGPADYAVLSYTLGVPDIQYKRHIFASKLFPHLGNVSMDVALTDMESVRANLLICTPMAASSRAPCIKRLVSAASADGYNCYVLISRGYGGTVLDSDTQNQYLDEYTNIHDIYEAIYALQQTSQLAIHLVGFSLGGMRLCHFVGDLIFKMRLSNGVLTEECQRDGVLNAQYYAKLNLATFENIDIDTMRKIYSAIGSVAILFANLDKRRVYLKDLKTHALIGSYQREYIAKNKEALEFYAQQMGKQIDFDDILQNSALKTMQDFDREVFARLAMPSQSLDDYYDLIFPSSTCFEAISIFSRTVPVLFLGAYDDMVTGPNLPILSYMADTHYGTSNLFTRSRAKKQLVVIQYRQGEHLGIIGANGKDAASLVMLQWLGQFIVPKG